ncbi:MAG: S-layer homology domain-containing protein [Evtepia gabavorous]
MAVTVLYRYAGSPAVEGTSGFADVPADAYYADGAAWCVQAGLITGKTETAFRPGDPMTREEFAATLYRLLVDRHGVPEQVGENNVTTLADFADAQSVSAFAQDAMAWAVGDLFLSGFRQEGDARELLPQGPITRGEMIHLLRQYDCLVEGNPAQLYRFSPEDVRSIRLQQGSGPQAMITDPAEIQRFLEKVNAFTYTAQENPRPAGGFYFFADLHLTDGTSVCLLLSQNGIDHHYTEPASEGDAYFPLDWMESFGLRK